MAAFFYECAKTGFQCPFAAVKNGRNLLDGAEDGCKVLHLLGVDVFFGSAHVVPCYAAWATVCPVRFSHRATITSQYLGCGSCRGEVLFGVVVRDFPARHFGKQPGDRDAMNQLRLGNG